MIIIKSLFLNDLGQCKKIEVTHDSTLFVECSEIQDDSDLAENIEKTWDRRTSRKKENARNAEISAREQENARNNSDINGGNGENG